MNFIALKNSLITLFQSISSLKTYNNPIIQCLFLSMMIVSACIRPTYQDIELLDCGRGDKIFITHYTFCIYEQTDEDGGDEDRERVESEPNELCRAPLQYYYSYQNVSICAEFKDLDESIIESAIKKWIRTLYNDIQIGYTIKNYRLN